jgi:hypothetical protein
MATGSRVVFTAPTEVLDIVVDLIADMTVTNPFDFFVEPYAEYAPFVYAPALAKELIPFLETSKSGPRLTAWVERFRASILPGEKSVDMLVRLNRQLQSEIKYLVRMEPGCRRPTTRWRGLRLLRFGVAARADPHQLGIAARFASGTSFSSCRREPLDGPAGPIAISRTCAWASAFSQAPAGSDSTRRRAPRRRRASAARLHRGQATPPP